MRSFLENALRQFRERNGNEGVQLLSELKVLVFAPGSDDAAGANVEPNGRSGLRVGVCHLVVLLKGAFSV
jgi:hypothetical protein